MTKMILNWALCATFAGTLLGQPNKTEEQKATIHLNVNLTLLHATVVDHAGQFVRGLAKPDFQLFVDGRLRPVIVFEPDDAPVSAGILMDNSASMTNKTSHVIAAALAFARASNAQDEMFVVHFNDQVRFGLPPETPFTGHISQLESALSKFNAEGTTALYDAIGAAIFHLHKTSLDRKVLIIISDGGDNSSHASLDEVLREAHRASVTIYSIGIYDDSDWDRNPAVLNEIAEVTSGKAFFPSELKDITKTCVTIASDIRLQYTLGFVGQEDGKYHGIKISAHTQAHGELTVRTRAGYFAPEP